jgi:hypothetical protein
MRLARSGAERGPLAAQWGSGKSGAARRQSLVEGTESMMRKSRFPRLGIPMVAVEIIVLSVGLMLPGRLAAQSDDNSAPLGDIARALRKDKEKEKSQAPAAAPATVIDNDNFSQVMEQAEKDRLKGDVRLAFSGIGKDLRVSSPDVTCNLSFNGQSATLLSDPFVPQDLPLAELAKLDGPAAIHGDSLEVTVYNPTGWTIREITVGLTIARHSDANTASSYGSAKLVPAVAADDAAATEKRSDLTVLYHLKGLAAPSTSTVFRQSLGATLQPDQDWHWAIVQAQGTPPR